MAEENRRGETIILKDENDYDIEYEFLDSINQDGKDYIVLLPIEQPICGGCEVMIVGALEYGKENEEYFSISSEEFTNVFEVYQGKMKTAIDTTNIDLSNIGKIDEEDDE